MSDTTSTTITRINEIMSDVLCRPVTELIPEADFLIDLGADSLDFVELAMLIEDEFDVQVEVDDANDCSTVGDFHTMVLAKMAARANP